MQITTCKNCKGTGKIKEACSVSGAFINTECDECEGFGNELKTYYANVVKVKSCGRPFLNSPLFDSLELAKEAANSQSYTGRGYILVKTIEVKI